MTRTGTTVRRRSSWSAARRAATIVGIAALTVAGVAPAAGAAGAAGDDAVERKAVLRASDFPAGWAKTPRRDPTVSGLDVCAGIEGVDADLVPLAARSPRFVRPDTDNVLATNAVVVLRSAKLARGYLEPYRDPDAVRCLEAVTEAGLTDAGFTAVGVYVTPAATAPSGADEAAAFGIEITVTAPATSTRPAQTEVIYQDLLVVRVGRALASFGFLNPGRPLPDAGELVDAVVGRLQDSLG